MVEKARLRAEKRGYIVSTLQIWVRKEDRDTLERLLKYFEEEQEERFGGKEYNYTSGGYRRKRKRILRERINESYVYSQALNSFFNENEEEIIEFEKRHSSDY